MLILAHRGYHVDVPENTLDAFDRAAALGVDGIETDVRMSLDRQAILFHDRLAPDGRDVARLTRSELSDLVGYPVPTLDSALERLPDLLWNLEIKTPDALDATVAAVRRSTPGTRFLVTSFWHPVVARVSASVPVDCGLLIAHCPVAIPAVLNEPAPGPGINTLVWYFETADPALVEVAAGLGWRNLVYGAVTPSEHDRLLGMRLDGAITDRPEYLRGRTPSGSS